MRTSLVLFLVTAGSATASLISVVANPDTSATYPVGTFFEAGEVAATTNPIGPFSGEAVQFKGWESGGSTLPLSGSSCPCLVFSYALTFSGPTIITSISFTGDAFNGATFELLSSTNAVLDSLSVSSGNVGHAVTYTMLTPGASGTTFTLDLYDDSSAWTYVSDITGTTAPEPATYLMVLLGVAAIVWTRRRSLAGAEF